MTRPRSDSASAAGQTGDPALEIVSQSPVDTVEIGRRIGDAAIAGDIIALYGDLGAGKTHLVKGIAAGLGVPDDEPVVSPTFVLVREYVGRAKLFHLDAYRLSGPEELLALGFEEMTASPGGVVVIEWAQRVQQAIPATAVQVELVHDGPQQRRILIRGAAGRFGRVGARTAQF